MYMTPVVEIDGDKDILIVCIGISTPPQKHHPLFIAKPPLNRQTVQVPPFLGNPPLYIGFSCTLLPPLKVWFLSEPPKILKFYIFYTILSFKGN